MKQKVLAKYYSWEALTSLAASDMQKQFGLPEDFSGQVAYIQGLDANRNIFLRLSFQGVTCKRKKS